MWVEPDRHLLRRATIALAAFAVGATLAGPRPALGQGEIDSLEIVLPPTVATGTASYDDVGRRDPFVPLIVELETATTGPRFETLRLSGVFLGSPGNSLVVLEDPANRGHFVRVGERLGNAVLVEIRPRSAVFEIREYGAVRREVLELERVERPSRERSPRQEPPPEESSPEESP